MKIKHLLALALMASGVGAWAQTDVTSTYLVNPSFETLKASDGTTDVIVKTTLDKGLYGWEVPSMSNYQVESAASKSSTGFPADGTGVIEPTDGTYYYFNRQGWANKNSELKTTTKQAVPAGTYYLCFDYKAADYSNNNKAENNGTTIGIDVKNASNESVGTRTAVRLAYSTTNNSSNPGADAYMVNAPWTQLGVIINIKEASVLTIAIQQNMKNNGRSDIAYDNLRLYKLSDNIDLTGLISNPSFETGYQSSTGWEFNKATDTGVKPNSNGTYTISGNDGTYIFNSWGGSGKNYIRQTIKNLPDGVYTVKATIASFTDEKLILKAGSAQTEQAATGKDEGNELSVQVKMLAGDLEIEASNTKDANNNNSDNSFLKADNFKLIYNRALTEQEAEELQMPTAKNALKEALDRKSEITGGDDVFMYPSTAADEYNSVISNAQTIYDSESSTLSAVKEATTALSNLKLPALNAPEPTQAYKIILCPTDNTWEKDGQKMDQTAITSMNNRDGQGGYNLQYLTQNSNYAQAMYFIAVEEGYKISFTDVEGTTRYVSTGTPHGGNNSQIRTTTKLDDAAIFDIRRNGDYINLFNVAANALIGAQDKGVYTCNSNNNFKVEKTSATNTITKTVAEGKYATIVLPYAVADVDAYEASISEDGESVVLSEVTALEANKAYILGAGTYNFSGVNVAYAEPAANGCLQGVYSETLVPVDSYVMQTQEGVQAFYIVVEGQKPKLSANKAYLSVSSPSSAKSLKIGFGEETAIKAIDALTNGAAKIYDVNGRELKSLQKGVNIVNGVKVLVK